MFFCTKCALNILKYPCQVYLNSLPNYLSNDLERLQKRALSIIYPEPSCAEALNEAGLQPLSERGQVITSKFLERIATDKNHKLHPLLSEEKAFNYNRRPNSKSALPKCKTKRCQSTFINCNSSFFIILNRQRYYDCLGSSIFIFYKFI